MLFRSQTFDEMAKVVDDTRAARQEALAEKATECRCQWVFKDGEAVKAVLCNGGYDPKSQADIDKFECPLDEAPKLPVAEVAEPVELEYPAKDSPPKLEP